MELILQSSRYDSISTEGQIFLGVRDSYGVVDSTGAFECCTLELPWSNGLPGSAIQGGRFPITLCPSPKFMSSVDSWVKKYAEKMPHVMGVPGRSYIMIHWGDFVKDTDGCILVGKARGDDFISSSRDAFVELYELLREPALDGDCFLTVRRDPVT